MEDLFDFIRSAFEPAELRMAPASLVEPLALPERSKAFLTTVGLPAHEEFLYVDFDLLDALPTLAELRPDVQVARPEDWAGVRFIGRGEGGDFGVFIDPREGGAVGMIGFDGRIPGNFLNSRVELLGWFLARVRLPSPAGDERLTSEQRRAELEKIEQAMIAMDPPAMREDADCFWPLMIEDGKLYA